MSAKNSVSIHVPAKGTTQSPGWIKRACAVSIHVPAKGTTIVCALLCMWHVSFNPRSREGNDDHNTAVSIYLAVSIHVPAKGTTDPEIELSLYPAGFNPRSREGNDEC